jgi:hypothetical protein
VQESSCNILRRRHLQGTPIVFLRLSRRRNDFKSPYELLVGTTIDTFPPLLLHVSALVVQYSVRTSVHCYSASATLSHICAMKQYILKCIHYLCQTPAGFQPLRSWLSFVFVFIQSLQSEFSALARCVDFSLLLLLVFGPSFMFNDTFSINVFVC